MRFYDHPNKVTDSGRPFLVIVVEDSVMAEPVFKATIRRTMVFEYDVVIKAHNTEVAEASVREMAEDMHENDMEVVECEDEIIVWEV